MDNTILVAIIGTITAISCVFLTYYLQKKLHEHDISKSWQWSGPAVIPTGQFTKWLTSSAYQLNFNRQFENHRYPCVVEGRFENGVMQFRAIFEDYPSLDFDFASHHGIKREHFEEKDKEYSNRGLKLSGLQHFLDDNGNMRYQATWINET